MLEKTLLNTALSSIRHGGIEVTYWDGQTKRYGPDKPWVKVRFNTPEVAKAMRKNLEMGVGEGYMNGEIDIDGDLAELGRLGDAKNQRCFIAQILLLPSTLRSLGQASGDCSAGSQWELLVKS